jgi:hypothetical protein
MRKIWIVTAALLGAAASGRAQVGFGAGQSMAAGDALNAARAGVTAAAPASPASAPAAAGPAKTVATLSGDFDKDGKPDQAVVAVTSMDEQTAGITITMGDGRAFSNPKIASITAMGDDEASISHALQARVTPSGSIVISSLKDWGTSVWSADTTVAYRGGKFVVAGFTYNYQYREQSGDCDLNFLTGTGKVNGKTVKVPAKDRSLESEDAASLVKECDGFLGL